MPWEIKKKDNEFCVYKKGTDKSVGCHESEDKAKDQLAALYKNAASERINATPGKHAERFMCMPVRRVFSVDEAIQGGVTTWHQACPLTEVQHPLYGEVSIDEYVASQFLLNFQSNVYGQDLPIFYEHFGMDQAKGLKAAGWVKDMKVENGYVWFSTEFTPAAADEINNGEWRYFSSEWYDIWASPEGNYYTYVMVGGALTNQPFFKGMMPLNFSEVLIEREVSVENEHADLEHSEPGTGSPPEPRTTEDGETLGGDTRIDTPPIELEDSMAENEDQPTLESQLRELLQLPEGDILATVKGMGEELEPLRKAASEAHARKTFSQMFPAEAAEMNELKKEGRENRAKAFSEKFLNMRIKDAEDKDTTKGFSALVVGKIAEAHKKFSEGNANINDFEDVLTAIANNGVVDYGEAGSSREKETVEIPVGDVQATRRAFAEKVQEIRDEDNLEYEPALKLAAERYPELASAYHNAQPRA